MSFRPRAPGALLTLSLLFLASALLRFWDSGVALALEQVRIEPGLEAAPQQCEPAPNVAALLSAISAREDAATARETELEGRTAELQATESRLDARMAEVQAAEESLRATMAIVDTAAEDDLGKLTAVYEAMKPKDAANLFAAMDPDFAAGFLGRMRPDAAAQVMAGLDPTTAYSISVILAGRNANAGKEGGPVQSGTPARN